MKVYLLAIVVFCAALATADHHKLKCYNCKGTEEECSKDKMKGDDSKQMTCPAGYNRCIRAWTKKDDKKTVASLCGTEAKCKERKDACEESGEGKCAISCCDTDLCNAGSPVSFSCDTDLCNAGSPVSFSMFLMAVCSALGLALLK